jgi:nucleotide-binding universal stress UspA family protein
MRYLIPVNSPQAAIGPIERLVAANREGAKVEAVLLNVQRPFNRRVAEHSLKADRDWLRAERSREVMATAIEYLSRAGIPFRAMTDVGSPAECIAAVAEAQHVDRILMGVTPRPPWADRLLPSMARAVEEQTSVPVTLVPHGKASQVERYLLVAGAASAGIAALLLSAD